MENESKVFLGSFFVHSIYYILSKWWLSNCALFILIAKLQNNSFLWIQPTMLNSLRWESNKYCKQCLLSIRRIYNPNDIFLWHIIRGWSNPCQIVADIINLPSRNIFTSTRKTSFLNSFQLLKFLLRHWYFNSNVVNCL